MKIQHRSSLIVAGTYLLFSTCWIIFSDMLVETYFPGYNQYTHAQTFKGLFFIVLSTGIILFLSIQLNRKKDSAEGLLRKAKSAFRSLFKKAPVGYCIINNEGSIQESNYHFRKTLGIKPDGGTIRISAFLRSEDFDSIMTWMNPANGKNVPDSLMLERKMICANGQSIWALINISQINLEGQYLISLQDLSSEKEILNELFTLKSELREIGKAGNIGHWEYDTGTEQIVLSDEIRFMLRPATGKSKSDKNEFLSLLSEEESCHIRNAVEKSQQEHAPLDVTFEYLSDDSVPHYFRLQGNWKISKKNTGQVLTGIIREITYEIKMLREKTEYIRHLDIWTGAVSHELRRPIATLGGLVNLLVKKEIGDPETGDIVRHMKMTYDEMDQITHRFGLDLISHRKSLEK